MEKKCDQKEVKTTGEELDLISTKDLVDELYKRSTCMWLLFMQGDNWSVTVNNTAPKSFDMIMYSFIQWTDLLMKNNNYDLGKEFSSMLEQVRNNPIK